MAKKTKLSERLDPPDASANPDAVKKNRRFGKKDKNEPIYISLPDADATSTPETVIPQSLSESTEDMVEVELGDQHEKQEEEKREKRNEKIKFYSLILACIYIVFLFFGVINTQYIYDERGTPIPYAMTVQDIKDKRDMEKLLDEYRDIRELYEKVLELDYRIGLGKENVMLLATEYEKLLEEIEPLIIQLGAIELPAEYNQVIKMLTAWTKNDIAVYCQNMSSAIAQNNNEYGGRALEYKVIAYKDFALITQNVLTLSQKTKTVDVTDIATWSPESYIQSIMGGVTHG